jgi:glutamate synthase domain-containing protein 1
MKQVSHNMLKELSARDLKNEYAVTLTEIEEYSNFRDRLKEVIEKENKDKYERVLLIREVREYIEKIEGKREMIKKIFNQMAKEEELETGNHQDTMEFINQVFAYKKHDADFRLKGIYTYDIRENP